MRSINVRRFRSVAAFLSAHARKRRESRRFRWSIAILGTLLTLTAALTAGGLVPPEGGDLAISASAVAFGLSALSRT